MKISLPIFLATTALQAANAERCECLASKSSKSSKSAKSAKPLGWCESGANNGYIKFPSLANAAKLEDAYPLIKGGVIMDQEQLDAQFCIEEGAVIASSGANAYAGVSEALFGLTEHFVGNTFTHDEMKTICFATCSKNTNCDYISFGFFTTREESYCHFYKYDDNKTAFKISPYVDPYLTTAIALKKNINFRDSAEMECDVPTLPDELEISVLCAFAAQGDEGSAQAVAAMGIVCSPALLTADLEQLVLPSLGCMAYGGGDPFSCLECLLRFPKSCLPFAEGICTSESDKNFITGLCETECNVPSPNPAYGGDCKALVQKAMLCIRGAPRTTFKFEGKLLVGGGCVNSEYDTITPPFTCPKL